MCRKPVRNAFRPSLFSRFITLSAAGAGIFIVFVMFTSSLGPARFTWPPLIMGVISLIVVGTVVYQVFLANPHPRRQKVERVLIPWGLLGQQLRLALSMRIARAILSMHPKVSQEAIEAVPVRVTVLEDVAERVA